MEEDVKRIRFYVRKLREWTQMPIGQRRHKRYERLLAYKKAMHKNFSERR